MISPLRVVMLSGGMLAAVPTTSSPRERMRSMTGELDGAVPSCAQPWSSASAAQRRSIASRLAVAWNRCVMEASCGVALAAALSRAGGDLARLGSEAGEGRPRIPDVEALRRAAGLAVPPLAPAASGRRGSPSSGGFRLRLGLLRLAPLHSLPCAGPARRLPGPRVSAAPRVRANQWEGRPCFVRCRSSFWSRSRWSRPRVVW